MLCSRTYKRIVAAVLGIAVFFGGAAFSDPALPSEASGHLSEVSRQFLADLGVPAEVREKLAESAGESLAARKSVLAESVSGVYSFAVGRAPMDRDEDVQADLEIVEGERQSLRARRDLTLHLAKRGSVNRRRYPDDDALGGALHSYYRSAVGTQSASDVVQGWVLALVWLKTGATEAVLKAFPAETAELDDRYCAFLYERAKWLFDAGNYSEALPVFKHLHDFRWANVGAYLDAAECFLRTGTPEECLKLLKEVMEILGESMSPDAFARTGRLFREAGDREAALSAFRMARERLRQGR
ncbi:MAG: tetratricopeptide repeat protein [Synergistaceae bacterium]|nr:tetratricopeptide repeat protein [Synergistaceae bacterium]